MSKRIAALMAATMGLALSAQSSKEDDVYDLTTPLAEYKPSVTFGAQESPIFTPRKHTKMKYADHKRMKAKRKNRRLSI